MASPSMTPGQSEELVQQTGFAQGDLPVVGVEV